MKKLRILTTLLFGCFLFAWCNPANPEPEIIDDCIIPGDCANEEPNEEFVSYYDNWAIREKWTYVNGMKEWVWTTYDEWWNIINMEEYKNWELVEDEEVDDIMNGEKLLSLYPWIQESDWNIILWDTLQTNYVNWTNNLYYDPYRGIAFTVWAEFDWGLIREIDTDENGYPHSEIIFLIKGEENEENRTWINWFREIFTITAISKTNLKNFGIESDFSDIVIWESLKEVPEFPDAVVWQNNHYIFTNSNPEYPISDFQIFDVEERY